MPLSYISMIVIKWTARWEGGTLLQKKKRQTKQQTRWYWKDKRYIVAKKTNEKEELLGYSKLRN